MKKPKGLQPEKRKLTIERVNGTSYEVEAEIIGDLALHPVAENSAKIQITHVPTTMTFMAAVPSSIAGNCDKGKRKLWLNWMTKVQQDLLKDWLAMRKFTKKEIVQDPDKTKMLRDRIRNHCLSTKDIGELK